MQRLQKFSSSFKNLCMKLQKFLQEAAKTPFCSLDGMAEKDLICASFTNKTITVQCKYLGILNCQSKVSILYNSLTLFKNPEYSEFNLGSTPTA